MRRFPLLFIVFFLAITAAVMWWWQLPRHRVTVPRETGDDVPVKALIDHIWGHPIEFWGKVLDQDGNPVTDADIKFIVNDLSAEGTTHYRTKSDPNGLFNLKCQGKGLSVYVTKVGYHVYPQDGLSLSQRFEYLDIGGRQIFFPDQSKPVVFRLRKKGVPIELVTREIFRMVPRDGTPVEVDLFTGTIVSLGRGHVKVECWTFDKGAVGRYDWKCRISIPDGGLTEAEGIFLFEAPEDGYRLFDEIDMPASLGSKWARSVQRMYYLKLRDGNFALLRFTINASGEHFFGLTYYLNPNGSRNLEHDWTEKGF